MIEAILPHDPAPWSCPMILLRFVFGFCKTLKDRSAEKETVGMTLRMMTTFPKFQWTISSKKFEWDNNTLGYINTEITQAIFFYMFYHRYREYLKLSEKFGNILGEFSSRILPNRAFHLNSEWNFAILFH